MFLHRIRKLPLLLLLGLSFFYNAAQAQRVYEDEPVDANISRINFIEPTITIELPSPAQAAEISNSKKENTKKVTLPKYSGPFTDRIPDFDSFRLKERRLNQEGKNFKGYRVQIYSGLDNNQAQRIRSDFILKLQGRYNTYSSYEQPYYRIRVGDFTQYWHARKLQQEILKDFPNAMVVQDNIHLPISR
ncbi:MAG: SPOR domain-containing protein [Bacteroidia bacterium]|nr:SPOR domain-containing protein [Bacteroidia bacterium]MDW8301188.1 SPOR domain-containing protein [Bacteroidia bacterium]